MAAKIGARYGAGKIYPLLLVNWRGPADNFARLRPAQLALAERAAHRREVGESAADMEKLVRLAWSESRMIASVIGDSPVAQGDVYAVVENCSKVADGLQQALSHSSHRTDEVAMQGLLRGSQLRWGGRHRRDRGWGGRHRRQRCWSQRHRRRILGCDLHFDEASR
jgi:hypothetical protein